MFASASLTVVTIHFRAGFRMGEPETDPWSAGSMRFAARTKSAAIKLCAERNLVRVFSRWRLKRLEAAKQTFPQTQTHGRKCHRPPLPSRSHRHGSLHARGQVRRAHSGVRQTVPNPGLSTGMRRNECRKNGSVMVFRHPALGREGGRFTGSDSKSGGHSAFQELPLPAIFWPLSCNCRS